MSGFDWDPHGVLGQKPPTPAAPTDTTDLSAAADRVLAGQSAPTPPSEEPNPLAQAADRVLQRQTNADALQAGLIAWRAANATETPERQAQVLQYSAASGLGPQFVADNLDEVKRLTDVKGKNWREMGQRQPVLTRLLSEHPETIPVVRDDLANMGTLEWLGQPFHAGWDAFKGQEAIARQGLEAIGQGGPENRARIEQVLRDTENKDYGARNFLTRGVIGLFKMAPVVAGNVAAAAIGTEVGAGLGAPAGAAAGAETGPGAVATGAGGAVAGAAAGTFAGLAAFNGLETLGPDYWRLSHIPGVDQDTARQLALGAAVVNGALMGSLSGKFIAGLPGVKSLIAKVGGTVIDKALADTTTAAAWKGLATRYGEHLATGATLMAASAATSQAAEEAAKAVSPDAAESHWANVGNAAAEGFKSGIQDMWLLSAFGPGKEFLSDLGRARAGSEAAVRLQAAAQAAAESKTLDRHPETFHAAAEAMAPDQSVHIPVEQWTNYWQGKKVDPGEAAAAVMGDGGKGFLEAQQTQVLSIPVADYLTKLGKTAHIAGLAQDTTLDPELPTPREQAAEQERLTAKLEELAAARKDELTAGKEAVFNTIRDQAVAAGIGKQDAEANAKIVSEYAGTMALRLGVPVEEAAQLGALSKLRILGPQGETAAEGARSVLASRAQAAAGPRGQISMALEPGGKPVSFDIKVLGGDKSTFAHETAHFLSWSLHEIANSDKATPEVKADYQALLKFAGYESPDQRVELTKERAALEKQAATGNQPEAQRTRLKSLTAKEERISHAWEQYLAEGKAPSEALRSTFSRFKSWLTRIYKGIPFIQRQFRAQYGEDINLSPEVRGVFDRLLATDDALNEADRSTGNAPVPEAEAAMTDKQREEYHATLDGSRAAAESETLRKAAEIEQQRVGEARARITGEVTTEVDQDPAMRAQRFLQRGELATGDTVLSGDALPFPAAKLDRKAFVKEFGADTARRMPPGVFADKGLAPEDAAVLLGFQDGHDLAAKLTKAQPRDEAIAQKVQARLDQEYGPAQKLIAEAAMAAVHNDATFRARHMELRAVAGEVNPETKRRVNVVNRDLLERTAERIMADTRVGDIDPAKYQRAERATALKASELWGKGDKEGSVAQREARLLNGILWRTARDTKAELEKAASRLRDVSTESRARLGKADPAYLSVHDQILGAVGLGPKVAGNAMDAAIERAGLDAETVDFDPEALKALIAKPRAWESLTADEARNVADAIANVKTIAGHRLEVQIGEQRQTKEAFFDELTASAAKRPQVSKGDYGRDKSAGLKARSKVRNALSATEAIETVAEMLDGGTEGPIHRVLIDGQRTSRDKAVDLSKRIDKTIREQYAKVPKELRNRGKESVDVADLLPSPDPSRQANYTRDRLWALFLNWGNEGNRQRIRDGNGWTDANVEKALSMLTKPETDFLQGMLDTVNSLYPDLAEAHQRRTGLPLEKVAASKIRLADGREYDGGYFPIRYDKDMSNPGAKQASEDQIAGLLQANYTRPSTAVSARKARLEKVNAPVSLEWGTLAGHLTQVIHDISYGDWVREAGSLVLDPRFKQIVGDAVGSERAARFRPWLADVANARADSLSGHQEAALRDFAWVRGKFATQAMALNFPSLIRHTFDPWSTMADSHGVAPHRIVAAYLKILNTSTWSSPELQASKAIAYRMAAHHDNLRRELSGIGAGKLDSAQHGVTTTLFKAHEFVDAVVSRTAFKAAFDQATAEGLSFDEAVKRADDTVERNMPSGDIAEKPPILRTKNGAASALVFFSYLSKMGNLRLRAIDRAYRTWQDPRATAGDKLTATATVAGKFLALGALSAVTGYFAGRGWRDKDKETAVEWAALEALLAPLDENVPLIGTMAKAAITGHEPNVPTAPELAMAGKFLEEINRSMRGKNKESGWERALDMAGMVIGPVGFAKRVGSGLKAVEQGKSKGPLDTAGKTVYGDQSKQGGHNPLSDLQDFLNR